LIPVSTTPGSIPELLLALQDSFAWQERADAYRLAATWERRRSGSYFTRFEGLPSGPGVVVKTAEGWAPDDAREIFAAMADLADLVERAGVTAYIPLHPLAWASDPPSVVTPYLEGIDLVTILRDPEHPAWASDVADWIGGAGEVLAGYHSSHQAPESAPNAREQTANVARRLRVDLAFDRVQWSERTARSFGDFGPGNLHVVTASGEVALLDPPPDPVPAVVHRDLGNFLFELRRQLAGRGYTRTAPVNGRFDALRARFLQGYSSRQAIPLTPADEALISLFEARRDLGMARKRLPQRVGDSMWFARSALARRREAAGQV
jgi:hypothetical protein